MSQQRMFVKDVAFLVPKGTETYHSFLALISKFAVCVYMIYERPIHLTFYIKYINHVQ